MGKSVNEHVNIAGKLARTLGLKSLNDTKTLITKKELTEAITYAQENHEKIISVFNRVIRKRLKETGVRNRNDVVKLFRCILRHPQINQALGYTRRNVREGGVVVSKYNYFVLGR